MAAEDVGDADQPAPLGSPDDRRGAPTVVEAVADAEAGSQVAGTHAPSPPGDAGDARQEEIRDVEGATTATVDRRAGTPAATPPPGPSPTEIGSGGAQRIVGARISDRVAAAQPVPDGPPFTETVDGDPDTGGDEE